ncbi:MAG: hypothetical protein ACRD2J_10835 [Thermoanaerobaculia bacterium]
MRATSLRLFLLLCLPLLLSCATAQMQLAPELDAEAALLVEGANPRRWNAPLRFGPWSTTEVREGGDWGFGVPVLGIEVGFSRQPYRLALGGGGGTEVRAECVTRALLLSRNDASFDPSLGRIPALACAYRDSRGDGTLRIRNKATMGAEGTLRFAGDEWTVRSVHRLEGSRIPAGDPVGWEIVDGDRVIAAVETINRGRVWIDPSLVPATRDRLAAVAASLLLYVPQE